MANIFIYNDDAGAAGDALLRRVRDLDLRYVAGWEDPARPGEGNCFFATTQMMALLLAAGREGGFVLRSGVFAPPEAPTLIVHAWLEHGGLVMNVSNLRIRPLYVVRRRSYYDRNFLGRRFHAIEPARVKRVLAENDGDVRDATKRLFAPAMNANREIAR